MKIHTPLATEAQFFPLFEKGAHFGSHENLKIRCEMTQTIKNDVLVYRMIGQSKGNSLLATRIIDKRNGNSIYHTLDRLTGRGRDDIPGMRLLCFQDLIDPTREFATEREKLKRKAKKFYGYFFPSWKWKKVKVRLATNRTADKIVLIMADENDKNNEIIIRLYRKEKDDKEKVKMTIRRKFALIDDISSYPEEVKWLAKFYYAKSAFPEESPFRKKWIKDNYVSLTIPLIPERKGGKLYFRILSRKSYYSDRWERGYLHFTLNEEGGKLIQSYQKRINDLTSNSNLNQKGKDKMITKLRHRISKLEDGIRYHSLSMTIRGLLDYASKERNYEEFKKTVGNLAESDEYQEIYPPYYQYDDRCEIPELGILRVVAYSSSPYKIKKDFPFLSHYDMLEKSLPENFVKMLLEAVAKKLRKEDSLGIIKLEDLRYMITEFFYSKIRSEITSNKEGNNNVNDNLDSNEREMLLFYLSEIGQYVQYIKGEKRVRRENFQRSALLQQRYDKLHKKIRALIDNNQNKEIIPIYEQIKEARIPWSYISDILKSIRNKYGNKFVITDSCFIAKSKARDLTALLAGKPTLENACASLTKHGLHKHWTRSDFWYRLGFGCGYEDSDTEFKIPRVLKLKGIK